MINTRAMAGIVGAALVAAALSGCVTINVPASSPVAAAPQSAVAEDSADYSAALASLAGAIGALAKSSALSPTADDCSYTASVANQMGGATPAPSWRGTYEKIASNMHLIAGICLTDPANKDAINLAIITRPDVVGILNNANYLGNANWG